nr:hypothetical protein [Tanacetum cinerariifolium]
SLIQVLSSPGVPLRGPERGLAHVSIYDPFVEAKHVSSVVAFGGLDFNLLSQLESQKDAKTSLSHSLNLVHARVQKIIEGALSCHLSISDAMGVLIDPLSFENLIGEASTSGVPATAAAATTLVVANVSSVAPISVIDYGVLDAEPQPEAFHSPKVVFEKEDLDTTPDHPSSN